MFIKNRSAVCLMLLTLSILPAGGCVHRRMTITSDPPGAMVYIDNHQIGPTPISHDFTYYGTRNFRLEKDGYETVNELRNIKAPWYQIPPLDFFSDNFAGRDINDHRYLNFQLRRSPEESENDIIARGLELKNYQAPVSSGPAQGPYNPGSIPPVDYSGAGPYTPDPVQPPEYDPYIGAEPGSYPPPSQNNSSLQDYPNNYYQTPTTVIE
ncbi:MAG: PEGA domain-containing protein [Thermoguttaceae bacterium]|nr:PEGA domain-containing protein [Thermoguttaceae bacterium]